MLALIGLIFLFGIFIYRLNKDYSILALCKRIKRVDGGDLNELYPIIPGKTIFGNNFDIVHLTAEGAFKYITDCVKYARGKSFIWMFLESSVYNVCTAEDAENVLNSQALLKKGVVYTLLSTFLGDGLLISTDKKWHGRRKLLTPAFHFNVLQSFIEIFKEESQKFLKILETNVDKELSLVNVIPRFTLNTVCETAMGVKLDNLSEGDEYRNHISELETRLIKRTFNPLYYYDWIYKTFGDYEEYSKHLKIVHNFTTSVVNKKREEFRKTTALDNYESDDIGKKKRYAMLDTLLDSELKDLIDHKGICEEVDTFMFEGYDTTSTCLIFSLMNIAINKDIQEKCYAEVSQLDDLQSLNVFDFNKMEYLECVIKETLRLYPSVPFITRESVEETIINGIILPKSAQINIFPFHIHRDPRHFPDPLKFDPNRFLPQNTTNRHPYAFIPFSAGPRNCIGQKFAMLEIKVLLANIIKQYELLPVTRENDIVFENGIVLRTKQDVKIKVKRRN
ncbi:probable cytochrome P450 4ac1 [Eupeodes corollae]|uniref:probable cytochrome P450 4ac1 n=1 Tax=Eupeodes corollae TaxID=290404 RepID=UPI002490722E|nr:probable cytochrome P450 4ac1 [Eupeodes corollae]